MILKTITLSAVLLLFFYLSQSCLLNCPPIWPDESFIADASRNLMLKGQIRTELWGEMVPNADKEVLLYPPAIFYLYSFFFKIFGISIETMRNLSSIFGLLVILIFFQFAKKIAGFPIAGVATILLALDNFVLRASRIGRAEIYVIFFGVLSLYLFYLNIRDSRTSKVNPWGIIIVGLTSALSALFNLAGLIFGTAI